MLSRAIARSAPSTHENHAGLISSANLIPVVYSQILICVSFVLASYQDFKERSVSDLVWIPAIAGAAYAVISLYPNISVLLLKIAIVGIVGLAFYFLGELGQADPIAMAFLVWDPLPFSLLSIMISTGVVIGVHVGYEYLRKNLPGTRTISIERFRKEQQWIPRAIVSDGVRKEVESGVDAAREFVESNASED
jgi:Flp pilus assembly protein protease CpaA